MLVTAIAFIVILTILVMVHELGHFITALLFGMKVEEIGFGFPPRAWSIKRRGIVYSINWFPIGGFVKLYGEDDAGGGKMTLTVAPGSSGDPITDSKMFVHWPAWKRFTVIVAGVVMNFILAVVLISYLFSTTGVAVPTENIKILEVTHNSPAAAGGLKKGDQVVLINNKRITDSGQFVTLAHQNEGVPMRLEIKRDNRVFNLTLTPRKTFPKNDGPLGVAITNVELKKYSWYTAPFYGTIEAVKFSYMIFAGLVDVVTSLAVHHTAPAGVAGPLGVAELTGQVVSYGFTATLWFVALLSLNLGVVNVLPIPALDGGRLFFIVIEMVTRRKVSPKYESMAHAIGFAVLIGLIFIITLFDIFRILSGQSLIPKM